MVEIISIAEPKEADDALGTGAMSALERGSVLVFPHLDFPLEDAERRLIGDGIAGGAAKNISYNAKTGALRGAQLEPPIRDSLAQMLARYARFAETLVRTIAPAYGDGMTIGRTSFRPTEIAGRETSWRKDDRRRHVDAFPSTPTKGARILRVFMNVDQTGLPRCWHVGPDFEAYAKSFLPRVSRLPPGAASLLALLGITKSRRTAYDQLMLGLHDAAKRDVAWQETAPVQTISFLPGQVWMIFTDQVPHAALSGRNALEQSFYIDPSVLAAAEHAPLAILARLTGRDLTRPLL